MAGHAAGSAAPGHWESPPQSRRPGSSVPAAAPSGTAQPHGGHQARRWPGAGSCWALVGRGQRRLENEGIDCETGINDPRLSSVDLFFKNPSLNLTKCSDAPAQAPVGPSGVGKESWHHFCTFRLRSESFLGSLYPDCPSPSLLPWLGLAGVPGGPGLPSAGPSAALGPTKAAPLHVY